MARYGIRKYLGLVFMAAVIAPAVVLSLLAIRAISHEEAYIEKQLEGTLSADVTHMASVVATEVGGMYSELTSTSVVPREGAVNLAFEEWKERSELVETGFLLSPEHEMLWPPASSERAKKADAGESSFAAEQQDFFSDREEVPIYENIAVAFQDEILDEVTETEEPSVDARPAAEVGHMARSGRGVTETASEETSAPEPTAPETTAPETTAPETTYDDRHFVSESLPMSRREDITPAPPRAKGEETRKQAAITEFQQSEEVRQKVFDKAENEGQEISFRNVDLAQQGEGIDLERTEALPEIGASGVDPTLEAGSAEKMEKRMTVVDADESRGGTETGDRAGPKSGLPTGTPAEKEKARPEVASRDEARADMDGYAGERPEQAGAGRIRSIFISQPLSFSEIVADRDGGIIPRTIDGRLRHIYWRRLPDGDILGCLIDLETFRDRIVGALPNIYSPVRILTVLDEGGSPLIIPQGQESRDWRRPFVAVEISELLPRWESAAYLTEPDAITSRARATTMVMWMLILILFVSILAGSMLVLRSAYAEVRLARQRATFVANVSHELKTPLTSIRMFAEMLRDGRQADPEKQKHYLGIMTAETERLTRLINNVLDFSRMERGEKRYNMKPCDLVAVARDVVESQRARLENNGFEVIFTTRAGRLEVNADEEAIKQAVVNLLSNAEKYSPRVKRIEIEVAPEDFRGAAGAAVSVSDLGIGIPPGEVRNIFDEFYRVDDTLTSEAKGAGLGLTIARKIAGDHGGDIRYAPREGGGSTFRILLPGTGPARQEGQEEL